MKELITQWFEQSDPFEGILACGVRFPDQTAAAKTWANGFTETGVEHALRCVVDCFQVLQLNRIPPARIRWVYQGALLQCERRQDGTCLGVFLTRDTASVDLGGVDRFFAEFQALATAAAL
jgi:hypothetical protein